MTDTDLRSVGHRIKIIADSLEKDADIVSLQEVITLLREVSEHLVMIKNRRDDSNLRASLEKLRITSQDLANHISDQAQCSINGNVLAELGVVAASIAHSLSNLARQADGLAGGEQLND